MRGRQVLVVATLAYALAWLLPSIIMDLPFGMGTVVVRGWDATLAALSPLWPGADGADASWPHRLLVAASGLTNFLFVIGAVLGLRTSARLTRGWVRAVWLAGVLNTQWFLTADRAGLRIGYYLWELSFILLAVAMHLILRERAETA